MPSLPDRSRLLLVGIDPAWEPVVREVAAALDADLDVVADLRAALARMLRPDHLYDHVLALAPIGSREVDALAGMLDEVTLHTTSLLLLGCERCGGANHVHTILQPDSQALHQALTRPMIEPSGLPPLNADELVSALHGGGLRMRFQPIVCAGDLRPIGLEALARVHTRERGILHPKDFIPATLACGRERVLTSIAAARTFLEIGSQLPGTDLFVTINLPLSSMLNESALARGVEFCAVAGIPTRRIMVEVLESRTAPDFGRLREALETWRQAGFLTAIDDAGPALPHWRDLLDLPFDVVKLDGAMVADPAADGLLRTIVGQARQRGRFIIAEGIEDEACLARIRTLAVDAFQGFLFARPLPALAVPLWLRQWASQVGGPARPDRETVSQAAA